MGRKIGIDLGLCHTVAAIRDARSLRVLDNREGKQCTPSVVSVRRRQHEYEELLVGDWALANRFMAPRDTIVMVRMLMGISADDARLQRLRMKMLYEIKAASDSKDAGICVVMGGVEYSPEDISAMILRKIREDAEFRLGEEVTDAVITVPAYFSQVQRRATRNAGLKAGLNVLKIVDEPTAAAIAFGLDTGDSSTGKTVLVYDLGGGTFDVSVLMMAGNNLVPLDLEGSMWLGGDDFDELIVQHALRAIQEEYGIDPTGDMKFMATLRKAAQVAKERLSFAKSADILITGQLKDKDDNPVDVDIEITRVDYERMIRPLVDESIKIVKTALENSNLTVDQVDYVLMAGNSTCTPMVQKAVEDLFGTAKVMRNVHPKNCVAMGAAIVASILSGCVCQAADPADPDKECGHINSEGKECCERCGSPLSWISTGSDPSDHDAAETLVDHLVMVAPFHYGIRGINDTFLIIINRNDPIPTMDTIPLLLETVVPDQRTISIDVYGGMDRSRASANEKQEEIMAILPPHLPRGTKVHLRLWLDKDGIFDTSAHLGDGTELRPMVLQGEKDACALEMLEESVRLLAEKMDSLPADVACTLSRELRSAYDWFQDRDFDGVIRKATEVIAALRVPIVE